MNADTLLFVPDISGFTEFVSKTEIEHSQHIISELLEIIIDHNILDMQVSEVEGDAVVFYKEDSVPEAAKIYKQAKEMFVAFHSHLRLYDSQRICQCGACSTASRLSLKFVVHAAKVGFTNIKNQLKPFGADVVLLHKLLKNDIAEREYVLYTNAYLQTSKAQKSSHNGLLKAGKQIDSDLGEIDYQYLSLAALHQEIPELPHMKMPEKTKNPIVSEHVFDLDLQEAYQYLSDFELKKTWNEEVREFRFKTGRVNRAGTRHICVFDKGQAEFETVKNDFGNGDLVYGERLLKFPLAREFSVYFILSSVRNKTKVRIETHYRQIPLVGWIFKPIINLNIKKIHEKFINSFSKVKREEISKETAALPG